MTKYEIMYIVKPTVDETSLKSVHESFNKILTDMGATIVLDKELGQKQFAYEIAKQKSGYYFLLNIESKDNASIKEFDRLALISEDVIRHLIIKLEK